jgi:hypothetical protein
MPIAEGKKRKEKKEKKKASACLWMGEPGASERKAEHW